MLWKLRSLKLEVSMNEKDLNSALNNAKSVKQLLVVLDTFYDLDSVRPSPITKAVLIGGLKKAITMTGAKLRQHGI